MWLSKAWKWLILGSACTIVALYLLEMTTQGIERVYGPMNSTIVKNEEMNETVGQVSNQLSGLLPRNSEAPYINEQIRTEQEYIDQNKKEQTKESNLSSLGTATKLDQEISELEEEIAQLKKLALLKEKQELQQKLLINEAEKKPAVNRVADSTSEVLQNASSSGLQFIATMFSKVID